jgi:hypothetical protein
MKLGAALIYSHPQEKLQKDGECFYPNCVGKFSSEHRTAVSASRSQARFHFVALESWSLVAEQLVFDQRVLALMFRACREEYLWLALRSTMRSAPKRSRTFPAPRSSACALNARTKGGVFPVLSACRTKRPRRTAIRKRESCWKTCMATRSF